MTFDEAVDLAREIATYPGWHIVGLFTRDARGKIAYEAKPPFTHYGVDTTYVRQRGPGTGRLAWMPLNSRDEWERYRKNVERWDNEFS